MRFEDRAARSDDTAVKLLKGQHGKGGARPKPLAERERSEEPVCQEGHHHGHQSHPDRQLTELGEKQQQQLPKSFVDAEMELQADT